MARRGLTARQRIALIVVVIFAAAAGIWVATSREEQRAVDVPAAFADEITAPPATSQLPLPPEATKERDEVLSRVAAADAQRMWSELFAEAGKQYEPAKITTYRDGVSSKCGDVDGSLGPFYCPAEGGIFLDLNFYEQMRRGIGRGGDFAWAYVVAHEVAHHVQQQTGVLPRVNQLRVEEPAAAAGDQGPSVRSELQADCYAGVWIHTAYQRDQVGRGDLQGAIAAAQAIGDDNLAARTPGPIEPDTFTHGSSEQRVRWLTRGAETGQPAACDTFALPRV